jgi:hypothetical protein
MKTMELSDVKDAASLQSSPRADTADAVCAVCGTACAKPEKVYRTYSRLTETLCKKCDLTYDKLEHEEQFEREEQEASDDL